MIQSLGIGRSRTFLSDQTDTVIVPNPGSTDRVTNRRVTRIKVINRAAETVTPTITVNDPKLTPPADVLQLFPLWPLATNEMLDDQGVVAELERLEEVRIQLDVTPGTPVHVYATWEDFQLIPG